MFKRTLRTTGVEDLDQAGLASDLEVFPNPTTVQNVARSSGRGNGNGAGFGGPGGSQQYIQGGAGRICGAVQLTRPAAGAVFVAITNQPKAVCQESDVGAVGWINQKIAKQKRWRASLQRFCFARETSSLLFLKKAGYNYTIYILCLFLKKNKKGSCLPIHSNRVFFLAMTKFQLLKSLSFLCFLLVIAISCQAVPPSVVYVLSMPQPQTHYFEVEMRLNNVATATDSPKNGYIDLKMPVWTPGSYLIREYAKNVEGFQAFGDGKAVKSEKIRKNTWRIFSTGNHLVVRYRVYAYELSVRTSFLDDAQGYLNGASIFLFHDALKSLPLQLIVQPYANWTQISTGLKRTADSPATFEAANYDALVDSPVSIGNQQVFHFTAIGIRHTVAMSGEAQFDSAKLATDMQKVCETAATIVGEHPCNDYTFLVLNAQQGGGGLEHSNSTTLHVNRNSYANEGTYRGFLSLVAHEYFHLWNIKRIRPMALGPFDYENENYTHLLWVAEGFTSFYQEYILLKAGFRTSDLYLEMLANQISGVENKPGNRVQSLSEASWDAWIKYYRPNENAINSTISYYDKGAVIGGIMNLIVLANTKGQRSLDNVMRLLYDEYYKKQKRGFSDEEFQKACEQVAGLPLSDFFQKHIYGTEPIDYNRYLRPVGLTITDQNANNSTPFLGTNASLGNRWLLASVIRDSPAELAGLNVGDEIVQIDGQMRPLDGLDGWLASKKVGDVATFIIKRDGLTKVVKVAVGRSSFVRFKIAKAPSPTATQQDLYKKWLFIEN